MVLVNRIRIEDEKIEVMKTWSSYNQYKIYKFLLVLGISIDNLSKSLVRLLYHLTQYKK